MKITSGTIIGAVSAFVWSLFMGVTAISIGVGAIIPQLNLIAQPFVCPNGKMSLTEISSQPLPTTTYTQLNWYCVDKLTEAKTELDIFPMSLYAGLFYGFLLFVVIALVWSVNQFRKSSSPQAASAFQDKELAELDQFDRSTRRHASSSQGASTRGDAELTELNEPNRANRPLNAQVRMDELKQLRDSNSITEAEYQNKRAELLKEL